MGVTIFAMAGSHYSHPVTITQYSKKGKNISLQKNYVVYLPFILESFL